MKRFTAPLVAIAAGATLLLSGHPAQAHGSAASGLLGGLAHPLWGLDHFCMLLAVGAAASFLSTRLLLWAAAGAVVGATLGWSGFSLPTAEPLAALAIAAMGGLILVGMGQRVLSTPLAGGLVAAGVAIHALLHGQEAPQDGTTLLWWAGALISSLLVCGGAYGLLRALPLAWTRAAAIAFLAIGGWLALGPIGLLAAGAGT